jgi:aquaporin Z
MTQVTGTRTQDSQGTSLLSALIAEAFGTFVLVFSVVGAALFSSSYTGYVGVALSIGLGVTAAIYAVGHISGGHFNPAVTLGLALAGRTPWNRVLPYAGIQILGAIIASTLLFAIASGGPKGYLRAAQDNGFASNGYADHSPGQFSLLSVVLVEIILTAVFIYVILGVTDRRGTSGFAPLAIGLTLTVIHLIAIPISNASVNPARSIATAIWGGLDSLGQVPVFIVAPLVGAVIAGLTYKPLFDRAAAAEPDRAS